jgi:hypothetical protein
MQKSMDFEGLSRHFQDEVRQLKSKGFKNWESLVSLQDKDLYVLAQKSRATTRNLKILRGMASFICQINLTQSEAALLLHAGIASLNSLSSLTPSQVIERTGRLERQLNLGRKPYLDIRVAKKWVENAKRANSELTQ